MKNEVLVHNLSQKINLGSAILRIMLASVLFPHGAQKMLGWFGGYGFEGSMNYFTETVGLPYLIALSVILIEFLGPLLLLFGYFSKVVAALIFMLFIGIFLTHTENGFFMNWFGNQAGEGYEYHLLVLAISLGIMVLGGGKFTLSALFKKQ